MNIHTQCVEPTRIFSHRFRWIIRFLGHLLSCLLPLPVITLTKIFLNLVHTKFFMRITLRECIRIWYYTHDLKIDMIHTNSMVDNKIWFTLGNCTVQIWYIQESVHFFLPDQIMLWTTFLDSIYLIMRSWFLWNFIFLNTPTQTTFTLKHSFNSKLSKKVYHSLINCETTGNKIILYRTLQPKVFFNQILSWLVYLLVHCMSRFLWAS